MTTLISRLPSLRLNSTGDPLNVHQRIESAPPSPYVEEADLGTFNDGEPEEDQVVDPDTQMNKRKKKKKKWKGKGREDDVEGDMGKLARERSDERLVQHHHRRSDSSGGPAYEDVSTGQAEFGGSSAYPPMNDEDMETRRIEENLQRFELMEKQRRKAAREARAARAPPTVVGDVTRRASAIFSRTPSMRRTRNTSLSGISWMEAKTKDSVEMDRAPSTVREEDEASSLKKGEQRRHRSGSFGSTSRSISGNPFSDSANGVTDQGPIDEPFIPPRDPRGSPVRHSLISPGNSLHLEALEEAVDETSSKKSKKKGKSKNKDKQRESVVSNSSSLLTVPPAVTKSSKRSKNKQPKPMPPPLVLPLDLPQPRAPRMAEQLPESSHWRRVQRQREIDQEAREEDERDRIEGRWWTDWLCGCRGAGHGQRDEQAGRTNPFE